MNAPRVILRLLAYFVSLLLLMGAQFRASAAEKIVPPRIIRTTEPRVPDLLIHRGIYDGEVRLIVVIDAGGRLADWIIKSFSHPILAREATEALRQWRFEAGKVDGEPVEVRTELVFSFHAGGLLTTVSPIDIADRFNQRGRDTGQRRLCPPGELDEPLRILKAVPPLGLPPSEARRRGGRAVVDFYIDEEGKTRLPVIVRADAPEFADATIEAINHWRFAVATRNGEPVITHAVQAFRFDPIETEAE